MDYFHPLCLFPQSNITGHKLEQKKEKANKVLEIYLGFICVQTAINWKNIFS